MSGWLFFWRRPKAALETWAPPEQLRRLLYRERELADRFGGGFSLLTFSAGRQEIEPQLFAELARIFARRLRCSDQVAWLDPRRSRVAVVMHRTPAGGAWKVAADVCTAVPQGSEIPRCDVYTYPFAAPWNELAAKDAQPSVAGQKCVAQCMEPLLAAPTVHPARAADIVGAVSEKTSCV